MTRTADVVVVGGGVVGASAAYHLASAGAGRVLLLERADHLAAGSTGACAGGFRYQFSSEVNVRLSRASVPMITGFTEEHGLPLDVAQHGYLFLDPDRGAVATTSSPRTGCTRPSVSRPTCCRPRRPWTSCRASPARGWWGRRTDRGTGSPTRRGSPRDTRRSPGGRVPRSSSGWRSGPFEPSDGRVLGVETSAGAIDAGVVVNAAGSVGGEAGVDRGGRPPARADPSARPGHGTVPRSPRAQDPRDRRGDDVLLPPRG